MLPAPALTAAHGVPSEWEAACQFTTMTDDVPRRVLITSVPFGEHDQGSLEQLRDAGVEYVVNPLGRHLSEREVSGLIPPFGALVAGTEPITAAVMKKAPHLKLIARVGIGLDSVDLLEARRRGIDVTYTPDAPAPAVAELTLGVILALLRGSHLADRRLRGGHLVACDGATSCWVDRWGYRHWPRWQPIDTVVARILRGQHPCQ